MNLRVAGETGVFGVDPSSLEMDEDGGNHITFSHLISFLGHKVPAILILMKKAVIEKKGIYTEGIFRLAGEQTEIRRIKEQMNKKIFDFSTSDVNAVATLMKVSTQKKMR